MQAFSLDFMRVFCDPAVENCMNSGDGGVAESNHEGHRGSPRKPLLSIPALRVPLCLGGKRLLSSVEAQDRIPLAQFALPTKRSKALTGVKMLVVLGDHQALRLQQLRLGEES